MRQKTPKREKGNVVLFIVEGCSDIKTFITSIPAIYEKIFGESIKVKFATIDEDAKKKHLKKYYQKKKERGDIEINENKLEKINIEMSGGDITIIQGIYKNNIEEKIYELIVKPFLRRLECIRKVYYEKDISEIIQIIDLDGVYIPDIAVIENLNCEKFIYNDDGIVCNSIDNAIYRNERKRDVINKLLSISSIKIKSKTVKYSLYFFSSNLDHFVHNNANLPQADKMRKAYEFLEEYNNKDDDKRLDYFFKLFSEDEDALQNMTYEESWNYIRNREAMESIKRHTNLNILFNKLREQI